MGEVTPQRQLSHDREAERLKKAFARYDKSESGSMDVKEFRSMLIDVGGADVDPEAVDKAIKALDLDKDGLITFAEFKQFWTELKQEQQQHQGATVNGKLRLPFSAYADMLMTADERLQDRPEKGYQDKYADMVNSLVADISRHSGKESAESFLESSLVRTGLEGCIFVGHVNTDLDSIAGAIAAADLYGGIPARSEEKFNGEIEYALEWIGLKIPEHFDSIPGGASKDPATGKHKNVCLVDHNEVDQMTQALKKSPDRMNRIVGLIDHHAVAASFKSSRPLFIDTRAWGSMATIVAHQFFRNRRLMTKEIARILLCAILSDTLNLRSGTTTKADRFCMAVLAKIGEVEDVEALARNLFKAKTAWIVGLGPYEMVRGDQKNFTVGDARLSIAVLEVTDMEPVLKHAEDLLVQLQVFKYQKGDIEDDDTGEKVHDANRECHCALLFVVDTLKQQSVCLVAGGREKWLCENAFPEATFRQAWKRCRSPSQHMSAEQSLCDVGGLASRKLEFFPMCQKTLEAGAPDWFYSPNEYKPFLQGMKNAPPPTHDYLKVSLNLSQVKKSIFTPSKDGPAALPLQRVPSKAAFIKVSKIQPSSESVNLIAKVVSRGDEDVQGDTDVVLGDSTGVVTVCVQPAQLDKCVVGNVIRIQNGLVFVKERGASGFLRLKVNKWGVIKTASEEESATVVGEEVKVGNDLSAVEYENVEGK